MSYGAVRDDLTARLEELRSGGLYKAALAPAAPPGDRPAPHRPARRGP